jgi:hypothetical protein
MDRLIKAHLNEGMVSALTDAAPTLLLLLIFKIFLLGGATVCNGKQMVGLQALGAH